MGRTKVAPTFLFTLNLLRVRIKEITFSSRRERSHIEPAHPVPFGAKVRASFTAWNAIACPDERMPTKKIGNAGRSFLPIGELAIKGMERMLSISLETRST